MSAADDWEEQMIDRLVEMFQNMGMSLSKQQIKALMEQFKSQFDKIGLDAEKSKLRRLRLRTMSMKF